MASSKKMLAAAACMFCFCGQTSAGTSRIFNTKAEWDQFVSQESARINQTSFNLDNRFVVMRTNEADEADQMTAMVEHRVIKEENYFDLVREMIQDKDLYADIDIPYSLEAAGIIPLPNVNKVALPYLIRFAERHTELKDDGKTIRYPWKKLEYPLKFDDDLELSGMPKWDREFLHEICEAEPKYARLLTVMQAANFVGSKNLLFNTNYKMDTLIALMSPLEVAVKFGQIPEDYERIIANKNSVMDEAENAKIEELEGTIEKLKKLSAEVKEMEAAFDPEI